MSQPSRYDHGKSVHLCRPLKRRMVSLWFFVVVYAALAKTVRLDVAEP